ncbi:MAG: hypothetical protein LKI24_00175 [Acidipropionibacterium sp.]|nr:hypothetical protein [Acidipropionibacterium sp.]
MRNHRSLASVMAAVLLGASLSLGAIPAHAAPISSGTPASSATVTPFGLRSMACFWLPNYCR